MAYAQCPNALGQRPTHAQRKSVAGLPAFTPFPAADFRWVDVKYGQLIARTRIAFGHYWTSNRSFGKRPMWFGLKVLREILFRLME